MHLVGYSLMANLVRFAVGISRFHATPGQPDGETSRIMIAAIFSLGKRGAAEFSSPPDERILEQAPLLQIFQQMEDSLHQTGKAVWSRA